MIRNKINNNERIIVCQTGLGFNELLFQRHQQLALALSKSKCLILYELKSIVDKTQIIDLINDNFLLINFQNKQLRRLIDKILEKTKKPKYLQIYSTNWHISVEEIKKYTKNNFKIIYEYIDDLSPVLAGTKILPKNINDNYQYCLNNVENVFIVVTASILKEDVLSKRKDKNVVYAPNAVDYDFFKDIDRDFEFNKKFVDILKQRKKIVGYYGALGEWFDYEMLKYLARSKTEYNIVLIGVKYDNIFDQQQLEKYPNIFYLGAIDYKILKNYASYFDICIIPFIINDITRATSPVKLFEYMALNKPIVTTKMIECLKYGSVITVDNNEDFVNKIDKYINLEKTDKYFQQLKKDVVNNTWQNRADVIVNKLKTNEVTNMKGSDNYV